MKKISYKTDQTNWLLGKREECPKNEIRYCYWYEYAREARHVGDSNEWTKTFSFLREFPEWPATPWLKIKPTIRQKRITQWERQNREQQRAEHALSIAHMEKHTLCEASPDALRDKNGYYQSSVFKDNEVLLGERPADGTPTKVIRPVPKDHPAWRCHSYFVHKVDWRESWQENMRRFKEWFAANKPADFQKIQRQDRKVGSYREGLKALAARRLVDAYGFAKAMEIAHKELGTDAYGPDLKTWKDALTRAEGHLATFNRISRR